MIARHARLLAIAIALTGCVIGAPPGFSAGDTWTFPLVGPLEDGVLITPVSIRGHGPYLFAINPDAGISAIDEDIAKEADLFASFGPRRYDEDDTGQPREYAEVLDLRAGNLTVGRRTAMIFPPGTYDTGGHRIRGVLGRDVIADSLVFGFDRDQGIATLSTVKAFKPPPAALVIKYQTVLAEHTVANTSEIYPEPRRLTPAQIGRGHYSMHLDLGKNVSQLHETDWSEAGLSRIDVSIHLVDEAASEREANTAGFAPIVQVAAASAPALFVPYTDRRFDTTTLDGALGLDFFQPFSVYANWDAESYLLTRRAAPDATLTARLGRWATALPACAHPGCVTVELAPSTPAADPTATAAAPGAVGGVVVLTAVRDASAASADLEALIAVTSSAQAHPTWLLVELPHGTDRVTASLSSVYRDATIALLDADPFPRSCGAAGGCVLPVAPAAMGGTGPALPSLPAPPPPSP